MIELKVATKKEYRKHTEAAWAQVLKHDYGVDQTKDRDLYAMMVTVDPKKKRICDMGWAQLLTKGQQLSTTQPTYLEQAEFEKLP